MHRRAAAAAAVLALVAGSGVAAAGSRAPAPAPVAAAPAADARVAPVRLQRSDLRSPEALTRAYRSVLASRATAPGSSDGGFFLYGGIASAVPIADVDGDRADDVLEIRGTAVKGPAVALRSGRTGRQKWTTPVDELVGAQYVPVPGGRPVVLTYGMGEDGEGAFVAYAGTLTLTVTARDATTGALLWSNDWTGVLTFSPGVDALLGVAFPGGVLRTKAGRHPTVLIDAFDDVYTDAGETTRGSVEYVDVVTGASTFRTDSVTGDASFCPVDDLDGDGTDDVVAVAASDSKVSALSGVDGHELWAVTRTGAFDTGWADPAGDLTGDRRADVYVATAGYDDDTVAITAVDGRTGRALWTRTGNGTPRPVGDLDRDGRTETRLLTYSSTAIRYDVVAAGGRTLWSTTVTNTVRNTGMLSWLAGDLNDDGVQDSYVRIVDRDRMGGAAGTGSYVVDGRTGRLSAHPDLGIPIGASLDGAGDDFARTTTVLTGGAQRVLLTAVDGRGKQPLWRRQLPVASSAGLLDVWAGDFSGTGRADLLDVLAEPDRAVVVVQHGRTGRTTWAGDYDTNRGFKPL